jgi:hypothetical protein
MFGVGMLRLANGVNTSMVAMCPGRISKRCAARDLDLP